MVNYKLSLDKDCMLTRDVAVLWMIHKDTPVSNYLNENCFL